MPRKQFHTTTSLMLSALTSMVFGGAEGVVISIQQPPILNTSEGHIIVLRQSLAVQLKLTFKIMILLPQPLPDVEVTGMHQHTQ